MILKWTFSNVRFFIIISFFFIIKDNIFRRYVSICQKNISIYKIKGCNGKHVKFSYANIREKIGSKKYQMLLAFNFSFSIFIRELVKI